MFLGGFPRRVWGPDAICNGWADVELSALARVFGVQCGILGASLLFDAGGRAFAEVGHYAWDVVALRRHQLLRFRYLRVGVSGLIRGRSQGTSPCSFMEFLGAKPVSTARQYKHPQQAVGGNLHFFSFFRRSRL